MTRFFQDNKEKLWKLKQEAKVTPIQNVHHHQPLLKTAAQKMTAKSLRLSLSFDGKKHKSADTPISNLSTFYAYKYS